MRKYYRLMLGQGSKHAAACIQGGFVGADFLTDQDLSGTLPDDWRAFNREFIPIYLALHPDKTKIGAGLSCGQLWTVAKGFDLGDVLLCPDGSGRYRIAEVTGDYAYHPGEILPHRRPVTWLNASIDRTEMSESLRNSTGSAGTVCNITKHHEEIEALLGEMGGEPAIVATDPTIEDPAAFVMEKHLEEFLVRNWANTGLGQDFEVFQDDGELVGQQYPTDTGPIDILAISKDGKRLMVVELKKGRASDAVVGQVLRYMGYVQEELAEKWQTVEGVVIALDDDLRLRRALAMVPNVNFYRYQVSFRLIRG
jgi:restriction system protein